MFTFSLPEAFIALFIGMGPIKVLLVYIAKTQNMEREIRRKVARRIAVVAAAVAIGLFILGAVLQQILHFSIGAGVSTYAYHLPDRVLLVYHNITPARWFTPYHEHLAGLCYHGRRELAAYIPRTSLALGDSEFNRAELEAVGFHPTGVLPLILNPEQNAE
jgi:hypothetical protein